jgi:exodeoxyribonuclease VII large subunit
MDDLYESPPAAEAQGASNAPELSVSQLASALKRTLEEAYGFVRVRGELGRVVLAKSGHMYFDIKDENAVINTVMWKGQASRLGFKAEEGLEVVAEGKISTYPGRSSYQLICDKLRPAGVGALMQLLEERRKKLAAEGLFDEARKKPIPYLPSVIGVVTSPTGAVIRDILHRVRERFPVRVLIWPSLVQGEKAAEQIEAGIRGFNALKPGGPVPRPDVIIVARGGGSIEDLWPFNEERVVRAAADSEIPLISAVGHETDTTLIDHAADLRAPTPTGAAERAVPVRMELIAEVEGYGARLSRSLVRRLERGRLQLSSLTGRLPRLDALLQKPRQRLDLASQRFGGALGAMLGRKRATLLERSGGLRPAALSRDIARKRREVETLSRRLAPAMVRRLGEGRRELDAAARMLESLSHEGVLKRGFALVTSAEGKLVRASASLTPGDLMSLRFADGAAPVRVEDGAGQAAARPATRKSAPPAPEPAADADAQRPVVRRRKRPTEDQGNLF